eukprot:804886-Prymnesium_polylepis.4
MPPPGPVPLIVDTDLSIDVDDVGALCAAHRLVDLGEVRARPAFAALHLVSLHWSGLPGGLPGGLLTRQ